MQDIRLGNKIYRNDSVASLNLSKTCINNLKKNRILTVEQFMELPNTPAAISMKIRKGPYIHEIVNLKEQIKNKEIEYVNDDNPLYVPVFEMNGKYYKNDLLDDCFNLVSVVKKFHELGFIYVADLFGKDKDDYLALQYFSDLKITEILRGIDTLKPIEYEGDDNYTYPELFVIDNIAYVSKTTIDLITIANKISNKDVTCYDDFVENLYADDQFIPLSLSILKYKITKLHNFNIKNFGITKGDVDLANLFDILPPFLKSKDYILKLLDLLMKDNTIGFDGKTITLRHMTLKNFLDSIPPSRNKEILLMKFSGKNYPDVAKAYDLTNQRAIQVVQYMVKKHPVIEEEVKYCTIFNKYQFTPTQFCEVFQEDITVFEFLKREAYNHKTERLPFRELENEEDLDPEVRHRVKVLIYKEELSQKKSYVNKSKVNLVEHVLRTHCKGVVSLDTVRKYYDEALTKLDTEIEVDKLRNLTQNTLNNLEQKDDIIWVSKDHLKYYSHEEHDLPKFYKSIDFSKYNNLFISSLKIFLDYPELMKEYDIENAEELHDLLRKTYVKYGPKDIEAKFKKTELIQFGVADLYEQLKDLLFSVAPISVQDFGKLVKSKFEISNSIFFYSHYKLLNKYIRDGRYVIPSN